MRDSERAATVERDPRWQAVRSRSAAADGSFVYSVATTGVYCRPSCAARLARPENVAFHANASAAEDAGFRACKRCKPKERPFAERRAELVAEMCRLIETSAEPPTLDELAHHVGLSPFHTHRLFKEVTGVTPRAYGRAHRATRVRHDLRTKRTVTEAIFAAGFNSSTRFYETSDALLGMKPTAYRKGAPNEVIRFAVGECSLGAILVAATARGVCAILLGDDPRALTRDLERRFPRAELVAAHASFAKRVAQVIALVEAPHDDPNLPLDIRGTAFQQRVWDALRRIPPGETASYAEIAVKLGSPSSVRAVAQACASNALAVAIPCHRIVRSDGDLSGYRWGVERKRALLARERSRR